MSQQFLKSDRPFDPQQSVAEILFGSLVTDSNFDPFSRFTYLLKELDRKAAVEESDRVFDHLKLLLPRLTALKCSDVSPLPLEAFAKPPQPTHLDRLQALAILGFDFKITPQGEVKLIEINGFNSGMKGFAKTRTGCVDGEIEERSDKALRRYLLRYGEEQRGFIGTCLAIAGLPANDRFPAVRPLVEEDLRHMLGQLTFQAWGKIHPAWRERYQAIADHLIEIEHTLKDKRKTDVLFEPLRMLKPRSYPYSREGLKRMVRLDRPEYVVLKPVAESQGRGVKILPLRELRLKAVFPQDDFILEPFVESKPILNSKTGQMHDGCLRYVALAEDYGSHVSVRHFGGYWRLCPKPMSSGRTLGSMRANLSAGALPERASEADLELVANQVEESLAVVWPELTAGPLRAAPPGKA